MRSTRCLLVLLLVGCAHATGPAPDLTSTRGAEHWLVPDSGMMKAVSDALEDELFADLVPYGFHEQRLDGVTVHWKTSYWEQLYQTGDGSGVAEGMAAGYDEASAIEVANVPAGCPNLTAYRHELLHFLQWRQLGIQDGSHERPEWAVVGRTNDAPANGRDCFGRAL